MPLSPSVGRTGASAVPGGHEGDRSSTASDALNTSYFLTRVVSSTRGRFTWRRLSRYWRAARGTVPQPAARGERRKAPRPFDLGAFAASLSPRARRGEVAPCGACPRGDYHRRRRVATPAVRREPPPSPRGATSPLAAETASPTATIPLGAALHLADVPRRESPREHHRPRRVATPPRSPANAVGAVRRYRRRPRPAAGSVAPQSARGEGCATGVVGDVAVRDPDAAERREGARRGLPSPRCPEARLLPAHGGDHRHVNTLGASCAFNERGPALERGDLGGRERIEVGPQGGEGAGEGAGHGERGYRGCGGATSGASARVGSRRRWASSAQRRTSRSATTSPERRASGASAACG